MSSLTRLSLGAMTASLDIEMEARKDSIFRKVGRNVVNLQRLEQRFKTLLSLSIDAPLSKLPHALEKRREGLVRQPMGPLTHEVIDRLLPKASPQGAFEDLATEIWINVSIGLEGDENMRRELRANLKRLVNERNDLVHHMFGGFDPRSQESGSALEQKLDAQRAHIDEVFQLVEQLMSTYREHMLDVKKRLEDPTAFDT
jgi:hypothetical protein